MLIISQPSPGRTQIQVFSSSLIHLISILHLYSDLHCQGQTKSNFCFAVCHIMVGSTVCVTLWLAPCPPPPVPHTWSFLAPRASPPPRLKGSRGSPSYLTHSARDRPRVPHTPPPPLKVPLRSRGSPSYPTRSAGDTQTSRPESLLSRYQE